MNACQTTGSQCSCDARRENGVQVTDGRYASMYKVCIAVLLVFNILGSYLQQMLSLPPVLKDSLTLYSFMYLYFRLEKMVHCHITPTSPPDLATEFPPQRAELYPGEEINFIFTIHYSDSLDSMCHI